MRPLYVYNNIILDFSSNIWLQVIPYKETQTTIWRVLTVTLQGQVGISKAKISFHRVSLIHKLFIQLHDIFCLGAWPLHCHLVTANSAKNTVPASDFCLFRRLSFLHYLTTCHLTLSWKSLYASHVTAFTVDSWCLSLETVGGKLLSAQPSPLTKADQIKNK